METEKVIHNQSGAIEIFDKKLNIFFL